MAEDPIPAGTGILATLKFTVSPEAEIGAVYQFDSIFIPPAGYMLLVTEDLEKVKPAFVPGQLTIVEPDKSPVFDRIADQFSFEGDTISFTVHAIDPKGEMVSYSSLRMPSGASFDTETGRFEWVPPYVGQNSSVGSPFTAVFAASDGNSASHQSVRLIVVNRNREPVVDMPDTVAFVVGDSICVFVSAEDPDFEEVEISVENLPDGANYQRGNPGYVSWSTTFADSGSYDLIVAAVDPHGAESRKMLTLDIQSAAYCELDISDIEVISGHTGVVEVNLLNRVPIAEMNLLIKYDPTALTLLSATSVGTRVENWDRYITTIHDTDGLIWLDAHPNLLGMDEIPPLSEGNGPVMKLNFLVSSNPGFAGQFINVRFDFLDTLVSHDNTFVTPEGDLIDRDLIDYSDGSVMIKQFETLIGDLNLNGVPFEVSDFVYYTNYFIDPVGHPLDGERWLNSDINQDGRPGTVGDLVVLMNIIGSPGGSGKCFGESQNVGATVNVQAQSVRHRMELLVDSDAPIGGALFVFSLDGDFPVKAIANDETENVELFESITDDQLRVLMICRDAGGIEAKGDKLLSLCYAEDMTVSLDEAHFADPYGAVLNANFEKRGNLPVGFSLSQNYPNPFNPSTRISFSLPDAGQVSLKIFNINGQFVKVLAEDQMTAGSHEVIWDGMNSEGRAAASGLYFYRLETNGLSKTKKMMLIK